MANFQECAMYYVYLLTNRNDAVMYVGVTNDLKRRIIEHRSGLIEGFTKKYHVHKLVYYETFRNINNAIKREKQLKGWVREKKNRLVESVNPQWKDLADVSSVK